MADMSKLLARTGLVEPAPKRAEAPGNVKVSSLADVARQMKSQRAQEPEPAPPPPAPLEEPKAAEKKKAKGRPPLDYATRQLGARVHVDTFDRVTAISRRERVGLGPLVDRMVREWERMRLSQAEAMGPRLEGEDDDTYIARVFRL